MVFVDINTFYGPKAGGIRTYHRAKLDWFGRQTEHTYCLIHPGPTFRVERPAPSVYLVQVFGWPVTKDPEGYRLLMDFPKVAAWLRRLQPDVIEAGDPWITGPFALLLRAGGLWNGRLVSFFHSDPVSTYFQPWANRGAFQFLRKPAAALAAQIFYLLQRRYDVTAVASRFLKSSLEAQGVTQVKYLPFGAHQEFFKARQDNRPLRRNGSASATLRLLYAGRLDRDKGIETLLEILPALANSQIEITVAGRGAFTEKFAAFRQPGFHFAGFVKDPKEMAELYASHDVLLAPGPHETFGLGVLEAMAAGLIVVGPDAGGTGELMAELKSPFQFHAGDAQEFLAKIQSLNTTDLVLWSARHREEAGRYGDWEQVVARMVEAWNGLVA